MTGLGLVVFTGGAGAVLGGQEAASFSRSRPDLDAAGASPGQLAQGCQPDHAPRPPNAQIRGTDLSPQVGSSRRAAPSRPGTRADETG